MTFREITKIEDVYAGNIVYSGRKNNFKAIVSYHGGNFVDKDSYWYYYINSEKYDIHYNSLWDGLKYSTIQETMSACEIKINEEYSKIKSKIKIETIYS